MCVLQAKCQFAHSAEELKYWKQQAQLFQAMQPTVSPSAAVPPRRAPAFPQPSAGGGMQAFASTPPPPVSAGASGAVLPAVQKQKQRARLRFVCISFFSCQCHPRQHFFILTQPKFGHDAATKCCAWSTAALTAPSGWRWSKRPCRAGASTLPGSGPPTSPHFFFLMLWLTPTQPGCRLQHARGVSPHLLGPCCSPARVARGH